VPLVGGFLAGSSQPRCHADGDRTTTHVRQDRWPVRLSNVCVPA
jgi:hypothetical protein